jgi:hypothetical protein
MTKRLLYLWVLISLIPVQAQTFSLSSAKLKWKNISSHNSGAHQQIRGRSPRQASSAIRHHGGLSVGRYTLSSWPTESSQPLALASVQRRSLGSQ